MPSGTWLTGSICHHSIHQVTTRMVYTQHSRSLSLSSSIPSTSIKQTCRPWTLTSPSTRSVHPYFDKHKSLTRSSPFCRVRFHSLRALPPTRLFASIPILRSAYRSSRRSPASAVPVAVVDAAVPAVALLLSRQLAALASVTPVRRRGRRAAAPLPQLTDAEVLPSPSLPRLPRSSSLTSPWT